MPNPLVELCVDVDPDDEWTLSLYVNGEPTILIGQTDEVEAELVRQATEAALGALGIAFERNYA